MQRVVCQALTRSRTLRDRLEVAATTAAGLASWAVASLWFYYRFPNNFTDANFYAEDGRVFTLALENNGLLSGLFLDFNGYYVVGLQFLTATASLLNEVAFSGRLIDQPKSIAVVSYIFLGLCAVAPLLALRLWLQLPYRLAVCVGVAAVPLAAYDYAIIGTIGNLKFAFLWVALLAVMCRVRAPRAAEALLCDVVVLICAYTTLTVYLLVPVLAHQVWVWHHGKPWRRLRLRRQNDVWSAMGLLALLIPLPLKILIQGVPAMPGYLDESFRWSSAIEVLLARPLLHSLAHPFYNRLTDLWVLLIVGALVVASFRVKSQGVRAACLGILGLAPAATALFAYGRPGVSRLFSDYVDTGPDQFFYAQNLVSLILYALLLQEFMPRVANRLGRLRPRRSLTAFVGASLLVLAVTTGPAASFGSFGRNDFMARTVGEIDDVTVPACAVPGASVTIPIYPSTGWNLTAPRGELCQDLPSRPTAPSSP